MQIVNNTSLPNQNNFVSKSDNSLWLRSTKSRITTVCVFILNLVIFSYMSVIYGTALVINLFLFAFSRFVCDQPNGCSFQDIIFHNIFLIIPIIVSFVAMILIPFKSHKKRISAIVLTILSIASFVSGMSLLK